MALGRIWSGKRPRKIIDEFKGGTKSFRGAREGPADQARRRAKSVEPERRAASKR